MLSQKKLASRLLRVKKERGLSYRDLTDEIGVSVNTLCRIARGTVKADFNNLAKLSQWLGYKTMFDAGTVCDGNTLPNIKEAIFNDKNLDALSKTKLWHIFEANYNAWTEIQ